MGYFFLYREKDYKLYLRYYNEQHFCFLVMIMGIIQKKKNFGIISVASRRIIHKYFFFFSVKEENGIEIKMQP